MVIIAVFQCHKKKARYEDFGRFWRKFSLKRFKNHEGVPETFWKPHQSKDLNFLHRSCIQKKYFNSKKLFFLDQKNLIEKKKRVQLYGWKLLHPKVSKKNVFFQRKTCFSSVFDASTQCKPKKHLFWKKWKPEFFLAPLLEISTWKKVGFCCFPFFFHEKYSPFLRVNRWNWFLKS